MTPKQTLTPDEVTTLGGEEIYSNNTHVMTICGTRSMAGDDEIIDVFVMYTPEITFDGQKEYKQIEETNPLNGTWVGEKA